MNAPQSSVVIAACIVTYRSKLEQLKAAAASFQQCQLPKHLCIVDNQSGDDYTKQLQQVENVSIIHSGANKGFGFGHNVGIRHAPACQYYLVLNPDVIIHEGALEKMVAYLDAHPEVGLIAPQVLNSDGSVQYLNKRLPSVFDLFARRFLPAKIRQMAFIKRKMDAYEMRNVGYGSICEPPFISGCCMLFRKSVLDAVGGFDEGFFMYLEDADMTRRVSAVAKALYYPEAKITHHWARGSHKSLRLMVVMFHSMWHYFNKWGWKWW